MEAVPDCVEGNVVLYSKGYIKTSFERLVQSCRAATGSDIDTVYGMLSLHVIYTVM